VRCRCHVDELHGVELLPGDLLIASPRSSARASASNLRTAFAAVRSS
jgi:hypothetical protein